MKSKYEQYLETQIDYPKRELETYQRGINIIKVDVVSYDKVA